MSDITNLANIPVEFPVGANKYKVSRLSLIELFSEFENSVKTDYYKDINEMANTLKDKQEKMDFMCRMMRDMPSGKKLEEAARNKMDSMDGGIRILYSALKKHNKISYDEVVNLSSDNNIATSVAAIIEYALGNDLKPKEEKTDEKKV